MTHPYTRWKGTLKEKIEPYPTYLEPIAEARNTLAQLLGILAIHLPIDLDLYD